MKIRDDIKLPMPELREGHWLGRCVDAAGRLIEGEVYIISGTETHVGAYNLEYRGIGLYAKIRFEKVTE